MNLKEYSVNKLRTVLGRELTPYELNKFLFDINPTVITMDSHLSGKIAEWIEKEIQNES